MKTLLIIFGIATTFILTQKMDPQHPQQASDEYRQAYEDSVLEAGRIEKMRAKFM